MVQGVHPFFFFFFSVWLCKETRTAGPLRRHKQQVSVSRENRLGVALLAKTAISNLQCQILKHSITAGLVISI